MKKIFRFLTISILFASLLAGCSDSLFNFDNIGTSGNVTINVVTEDAARTIRPNAILAADFSRIVITFTMGGSSRVLTLTESTTGSIDLEPGIWGISAVGFITINNTEYEAARGTSSVYVTEAGVSASVELVTGIFAGAPGVFSYNVNFGAETITSAEIDLTPFSFTGSSSNAGRSIDITDIDDRAGSIELQPGYYLVSISAANGSGHIALWNELVHIYSGRESVLPAGIDFKFTGTITISGDVLGGEFNDSYITQAVVTAYSDSRYISRVASVNIGSFTRSEFTEAGLANEYVIYSGDWEMTLPLSFNGKEIYFLIEETMATPAGTETYIWDYNIPMTVADGEFHSLTASFVWFVDDAIQDVYFDSDVLSITTPSVTENPASQTASFTYPMQTGIRYVFVFDAWTSDGPENRPIFVNSAGDRIKRVEITSAETEYYVISDSAASANDSPFVNFRLGHTETGTVNIRLKGIIPNTDFVPPVGSVAFTATPQEGGVKLKIENLDTVEPGLRGIMFTNVTTRDLFFVDWWDPRFADIPETYEFLFPYVQADNEYVFEAELQPLGIFMRATVTATDGEGELKFANFADLTLTRNGYFLTVNPAPVLNANISGGDYNLELFMGSSIDDPFREYQYRVTLPQNALVFDLRNFPENFNISDVAGKEVFGNFYYKLPDNDNSIYLSGQSSVPELRGTFRTNSLVSASFIHPVIGYSSDILIATPHPEGVLLTVKTDLLPAGTTSLQFRQSNWSNMRLYLDQWYWKEPNGQFYERNIEIIYPFTVAGRVYDFSVSIGGVNETESSTTTAGGGIGEAYYTDTWPVQLTFNEVQRTMTLNTIPSVSSFADHEKVGDKSWRWAFYKGTGWDDNQWGGQVFVNPILPVLSFDDDFGAINSFAGELSGNTAFAVVGYTVTYDGFMFNMEESLSQPFVFPYYPESGNTYTFITSAFETNDNLYIHYPDGITSGDNMDILFRDENYWNGGENATRVFYFYIDGAIITPTSSTGGGWPNHYNFILPTASLSAGVHFGTLIVEIDGAAFAQEFTFTVR